MSLSLAHVMTSSRTMLYRLTLALCLILTADLLVTLTTQRNGVCA